MEQSWIDGVVRITISHRFNGDYVNNQRMLHSLDELLLNKDAIIEGMVRDIRYHENESLRNVTDFRVTDNGRS